MANTMKQLFQDILPTAPNTLYTTPAATKTLVREVILCNSGTIEHDVTIAFANIAVINRVLLPSETLIIELHSVLETTNVITGATDSGIDITCYISGIEIT